MKNVSLFEPFKLGDLELKNRIVMAPMTRARAPEHVPTDSMATYYAQRAGAGLIISEAVAVSPQAIQDEHGCNAVFAHRAWS